MTYGTIKHGRVKFKLGSQQDKFLHVKKLPHTHIHLHHGKKVYERWFAKKKK